MISFDSLGQVASKGMGELNDARHAFIALPRLALPACPGAAAH